MTPAEYVKNRDIDGFRKALAPLVACTATVDNHWNIVRLVWDGGASIYLSVQFVKADSLTATLTVADSGKLKGNRWQRFCADNLTLSNRIEIKIGKRDFVSLANSINERVMYWAETLNDQFKIALRKQADEESESLALLDKIEKMLVPLRNDYTNIRVGQDGNGTVKIHYYNRMNSAYLDGYISSSNPSHFLFNNSTGISSIKLEKLSALIDIINA